MKAKIHYKRMVRAWRVKTCKGESFHECFVIRGGWKAVTKPNKRNDPRGWVEVDTCQIDYTTCLPDTVGMVKLCYDRKTRSFNVAEGDAGLVVTPNGIFIM